MVGGNRLLRCLGLGASLAGFFSICFSSFLSALHHFRLIDCLYSDRQEEKKWAKILTLSNLTALGLLIIFFFKVSISLFSMYKYVGMKIKQTCAKLS